MQRWGVETLVAPVACDAASFTAAQWPPGRTRRTGLWQVADAPTPLRFESAAVRVLAALGQALPGRFHFAPQVGADGWAEAVREGAAALGVTPQQMHMALCVACPPQFGSVDVGPNGPTGHAGGPLLAGSPCMEAVPALAKMRLGPGKAKYVVAGHKRYVRVALGGGVRGYAHRAVLFLICGPPPDIAAQAQRLGPRWFRKHMRQLDAMHLCNNPSCINPLHLAWGSRQVNMAHHAATVRGPVDLIAWLTAHPALSNPLRRDGSALRAPVGIPAAWRASVQQPVTIHTCTLAPETPTSTCPAPCTQLAYPLAHNSQHPLTRAPPPAGPHTHTNSMQRITHTTPTMFTHTHTT